GWIVGFTCVVTAALAAIGNLLPMSRNIIEDLRMGIVSPPGSGLPVAPKAYWIVLTAAAAVGLSLLLLVLFDLSTAAIRGRDERGARLRFRVVFLVLTGVLYFGPLGALSGHARPLRAVNPRPLHRPLGARAPG